jgi:hypothetical protein
MSQKERVAASLEQITSLCFRISGLVVKEEEDEKAVSTFPPCISSSESQLTATSPPFVSKDKEKIGVFDSASVLVTPVCSGYIGALTKPRSSVSDKVEASSFGSSAMAAAMQHANTVPAFLAAWNAAPDENARQALEQVALTHGTTAVRIEALLKRDERSRADMAALQASLNAAIAAVNAANANAQAAQAVAAAATASALKPNPPPRYENKDKDMEIRKWLPIVENYARACADGNYLRTVGSYLHGNARSYFQSKYNAYKAANGGAEPANPRKFFRETMVSGYGLSDQTRVYWDNWNNLRILANMDIGDYNIAFTQCLTDLGDQIQGEQVKIEKYRLGLQSDMRKMVCTSSKGTRWESLKALIEYCLLQWPIVAARIVKRTKNPPGEKVGGKRKASGGGGGSSSKPKLGATGRLFEEQKAHNVKNGLCHICGKAGHIAKDCPDRDPGRPFYKNKKQKKGKKDSKDS